MGVGPATATREALPPSLASHLRASRAMPSSPPHVRCPPRCSSCPWPCGDARHHAECTDVLSPFLLARRGAPLLALSFLRRLSRIVIARTGAQRQAPATTLDPIVVTASRMPQPIARRPGRRHRHRAGRNPAQRRAEPRRAAAAAAGRRDRPRTAGRAATSGASARRQPGQTLVLIDGLRAARRRRAPPRSRRFRSTRSTTSRSCADRRRASTAPMRSAASSRCSPSARTGATFTPNVSAGYGTYNTGAVSAGFARHERPAALLAAGRRTHQRRLQRDRQSRQLQLQPRPRRIQHAESLGQRWAGRGRRAGAVGAVFRQSPQRAIRRRPAYFDDRTITTVQAWTRRSAATGSTMSGLRC